MAHGTTEIGDIVYVDRGYEDVVEKFTALGANIRRVEDFNPNHQKAAL